MKTQLTAGQSAKLIELGVSRSKANGLWLPHVTEVQPYTLADILDILPKEINAFGIPARLQMYNHPAEYWIVSYVTYDGGTLTYHNPCSAEKELIDALYSLLVWCLEKGYVK